MGVRRKRGRSAPGRVAEPVPSFGGASPGSSGARRAKLFWNGRSQAVRLPREFRFEGAEVAIRREGDRVILEPVRESCGWPVGYWERLGELRDLFRDFEVPEPLAPGGTDVDFNRR